MIIVLLCVNWISSEQRKSSDKLHTAYVITVCYLICYTALMKLNKAETALLLSAFADVTDLNDLHELPLQVLSGAH